MLVYILGALLLLVVLLSTINNPLLNAVSVFILVFFMLSLYNLKPLNVIIYSTVITVILISFRSYNNILRENLENKNSKKEDEEETNKIDELKKPVDIKTESVKASDLNVEAENSIDIAHYSNPENAENINEKTSMMADKGKTVEVNLGNKKVSELTPDVAQRKAYQLVNSIKNLQKTTESLGMLLDKSKPILDLFHNLPFVST